MQDTYVRLCADGFRLLRGLKTKQDNGVHAFVQSVAYSTAIDNLRSQHASKRGAGIHPISLDGLVRDIAISEAPSNQLETRLLLDRVNELLDEVAQPATKARDITVFWLHYQQGFTALEISKIPSVGLAAKEVENLIARLREKIRLRIQENDKDSG